jgi:hypothetical protein
LIKSGRVKLVLQAQTSLFSEMMQLCKWFPHVIKMPSLTLNWANSIIIKSAIILNIMRNVFYLRDMEVVICIILVLLNPL